MKFTLQYGIGCFSYPLDRPDRWHVVSWMPDGDSQAAEAIWKGTWRANEPVTETNERLHFRDLMNKMAYKLGRSHVFLYKHDFSYALLEHLG